jgi:hypothetical protein
MIFGALNEMTTHKFYSILVVQLLCICGCDDGPTATDANAHARDASLLMTIFLDNGLGREASIADLVAADAKALQYIVPDPDRRDFITKMLTNSGMTEEVKRELTDAAFIEPYKGPETGDNSPIFQSKLGYTGIPLLLRPNGVVEFVKPPNAL